MKVARKFLILSTFFLSMVYIIGLILIFIQFNSSARNNVCQDKCSNITDHISSLLDPVFRGADFMSQDPFIQDWLTGEKNRESLDSYLQDHVKLIGCDAIDVASSLSDIVYQSAGTQVNMEQDNERDSWYYDFQESDKSCGTELFYDSLKGILYIYYNVKIFDTDGTNLGVLGFLISYSSFSDVLSKYENENLTAYIINSKGEILIHPDQRQIGNITIYDYYGKLQSDSSSFNESGLVSSGGRNQVSHSHYLEKLDVYLVTEQTQNPFQQNLITFTILMLLLWFLSFFIIKTVHRRLYKESS
ncbi:MAG: hypothetical protein B6241_14280 [Spirochaetaceae bacterium 4572_59]|nr:MAG: hypothetical protein B6241_14280 [Spirochaetaceae bacterium 4572_59]